MVSLTFLFFIIKLYKYETAELKNTKPLKEQKSV